MHVTLDNFLILCEIWLIELRNLPVYLPTLDRFSCSKSHLHFKTAFEKIGPYYKMLLLTSTRCYWLFVLNWSHITFSKGQYGVYNCMHSLPPVLAEEVKLSVRSVCLFVCLSALSNQIKHIEKRCSTTCFGPQKMVLGLKVWRSRWPSRHFHSNDIINHNKYDFITHNVQETRCNYMTLTWWSYPSFLEYGSNAELRYSVLMPGYNLAGGVRGTVLVSQPPPPKKKIEKIEHLCQTVPVFVGPVTHKIQGQNLHRASRLVDKNSSHNSIRGRTMPNGKLRKSLKTEKQFLLKILWRYITCMKVMYQSV